MLLLRCVAIFAVLFGFAACDGDRADDAPGADAGSTAEVAEVVEGRRLDVAGERSFRLVAGAEIGIRVRLLGRDGRPIAHAPVAFALIGRAQDASLAELTVTTDAEGMAANTLTAGEMVATFRVRVSAEGADDVYLDVAVSDAGFGMLAVEAPYTGARVVAQRVLTAQAEARCGAEVTDGDPMLTLTDADEAVFIALPAETRYAVSAVASGADGTVLARGCVDEIQVEADGEVRATVEFGDEPLQPAGTFDLEATLDTTAPAESLVEALEEAVVSLVLDVAGDAHALTPGAALLLDSLDDTLRSEPYSDRPGMTDLADAIEAERAVPTTMPTLDESLQLALETGGHGPEPVIERLAGAVTESLSRTKLAAQVMFDRDGKDLPMAWRALRVDAVPVPERVNVPTVDLSMLDDDAVAEADFRAAKDAVEIVEVRFRLSFGALAAQSLRAMASGEGGIETELLDDLGCDVFRVWRETQSVGPDVCHGPCMRAACERALARMLAAAELAWGTVDEQRARVRLHGTLALEDEDGDLDVERIETDLLWGDWEAASADTAADFVSGPAHATIVADDGATPGEP